MNIFRIIVTEYCSYKLHLSMHCKTYDSRQLLNTEPGHARSRSRDMLIGGVYCVIYITSHPASPSSPPGPYILLSGEYCNLFNHYSLAPGLWEYSVIS